MQARDASRSIVLRGAALLKKATADRPSHAERLRHRVLVSPLIDPVQKFDKPLAIDPKKDFVVFGVVQRELRITAAKRDPNLTVNQFRTHSMTFAPGYYLRIDGRRL
jgi:hypothetical protein